ncbi:ATP-binding cassette domain-containing protein, partial [Zunongwangia profunda]
METILSINQLTKVYGPLKAVDNLSFTIEKGNVYGILGPNGSGKSTTLGMVLNVVNKTSGDFKWFNGSESTHEAL